MARSLSRINAGGGGAVALWILKICAFLAIFVTFGIVFSLLLESVRFFSFISPVDFLFGVDWSPETLYHTPTNPRDWGGFGILPLLSGSFLITLIALIVAVPLGLMIAIYTREYASSTARSLIKPVVDILAGIPTIVYGFFALGAVTPFLQKMGAVFHVTISPQSALGVGIVMGLMILPFIASLSDEALGSVPRDLRDSSLALGATLSETICHIVVPAAFPGIMSAFLLAASRAVGETMLVVMASGLSAHLTLNPLDSATTVTVQIVSLLTGDGAFDSPKTLSAFALGLILFLITLSLNIVAHHLVRRHIKKRGV